jgi:hypothetical protein
MMEAVRTSETSVDNYFTRQYIPEDNSERIFSSQVLNVSRIVCMNQTAVFSLSSACELNLTVTELVTVCVGYTDKVRF